MTGLLLDTHALLWYAADNPLLSPTASKAITDTPRVFVSAASAWEIRTKFRLGRLPGAYSVARDVAEAVRRMAFVELPIGFADAELAGALPGKHRDPFDRMIAAQALGHSLHVASNDAALDAFGVTRVW